LPFSSHPHYKWQWAGVRPRCRSPIAPGQHKQPQCPFPEAEAASLSDASQRELEGPSLSSEAPRAEGKEVSDDKDDFEQADAAADAALEYARSLPPGIARSEAFKRLRGCEVLPTDCGPRSLLLAVDGLNRRASAGLLRLLRLWC